MVGAQFGARRARDDALRNRIGAGAIWIVGIAPAREVKHSRLRHILDHRKTASHVAIQRAIAGGHFALVTGGEHDGAKLVGQGHE
ncbi:hypothetical protein D3C71_1805000 [compost metagenome]